MFTLGLQRAGMKCIGQVENDPFRIKVLEQHFPEIPRYKDVKKYKTGQFGTAQLICAGYPCQGESNSGKRRGADDDRWLWPETFEAIKGERPDWFIGENVIGHESMGLKVVKADLESAGYKVRPFIIPSAACGLPTVERHIWIVASTDEKRLQRYIEKPFQWKPAVPEEFQRDDTKQFTRWALPESRVCRVGKRCPNWVDRIKAIGDAIPPQIPEIIGSIIMEIENANT